MGGIDGDCEFPFERLEVRPYGRDVVSFEGLQEQFPFAAIHVRRG